MTDQGRVVSTELTAPQPLKRFSKLSAEQAAACLSLQASEVKIDRHAPQIISVGLSFLAVELASREALRRGRPAAAGVSQNLPGRGRRARHFFTRGAPAGEKTRGPHGRGVSPRAARVSEEAAA